MARTRQIVQEPEPKEQWWCIVNFEAVERLAIWATFWELGNCIWSPALVALADLLATPVDATPECPFGGWSTTGVPAPSGLQQPSQLPRLPTDVLKLIFDELDSREDAVFLCLAHESLGACGERRVYELVLRDFAPWRGQRLACIGSDTRSDDYPPHLQPYVDEWTRSPAAQAPHPPGDPTFAAFVALGYREQRGGLHVHAQLEKRADEAALTPSARAKVAALLQGIRAVEASGFHERGRALCNLSKGEFVREDAVRALHARRVTGNWQAHRAITLGQALLCMVCWSSEKWCAMNVDIDRERLSRGPWAGDRFEVVLVGRMRQGVAWRDVTEDVVDWLEQMWVVDHYVNHP